MADPKNPRPFSRLKRAIITSGVVAGGLGGGAFLLRNDEAPEPPPETAASAAHPSASRTAELASSGAFQLPPAPPSQQQAAAPGAPAIEDTAELRADITATWTRVRSGERDSFSLSSLSSILGDIKRLRGKENATFRQLTEQDYAEFGIRKDEFLSLVSENSIASARERLQTANHPELNREQAYQSLSAVKAHALDTIYGASGDAQAALASLCSMLPECGSVEQFNARLKDTAAYAAQNYAATYKKDGFNPFNAMATYYAITQAMKEGGMNPADDAQMRAQVGMTHAEFKAAAEQKAAEQRQQKQEGELERDMRRMKRGQQTGSAAPSSSWQAQVARGDKGGPARG